MKLNDDQFCFACGKDNPDGLQLKFEYPEPGACRAEFIPTQKYQGWQGILHGGIVSTLLDEALAHAAGGSEGGGGASGPVPIGERVILTGRVLNDKGRMVEAESNIAGQQGNILASASGKLVRPAGK